MGPEMAPEYWEKVKQIVAAILEYDPSEWPGLLDIACGGNAALRQDVESLLAEHRRKGPLDETGVRETLSETQFVRRLFDDALARPREERRAFLWSACGGDATAFEQAWRLVEMYQAAPGASDSPAQRFGRYAVLAELGDGGMGVVYRAFDPQLERNVAVKVVRPDRMDSAASKKDWRERLLREARLAGGLSHPGIVVVYDAGREGDAAYIAMEYVTGPSMDKLLRAGPLPLPKARAILRQVAAALDFAHQKGVIHRDVKPANILLQDGVLPKVTDFGIATLSSDRTGDGAGTLPYMAPEQADGQEADIRSDQFSLAAVAYEMLTGKRAFMADTEPALHYKIREGERPSAAAANPALPPAIDAPLHRGLSRYAGDRFGSCTEFVAALEACFEDVPQARNTELEALLREARRAMAAGELRKAQALLESGRKQFGNDIKWRMLRYKLDKIKAKQEA